MKAFVVGTKKGGGRAVNSIVGLRVKNLEDKDGELFVVVNLQT